MTFIELVESLAKETGLPKTRVSRLLKAFQAEVKKTLKSGERITLPGFGVFYSVALKPRLVCGVMSAGRRKMRFKERRTSEASVDKYAVEIDDEKTKTASEEKVCPGCGGPMADQESLPPIPYCSTCGTKPFEKRPSK